MNDMYIKEDKPVRLPLTDWQTILSNLDEYEEEVEITWLDPGDSSEGEWCLHCGDELFEDGFKSEREALDRLREIDKAVAELNNNKVCTRCGEHIPKGRKSQKCIPCMMIEVIEGG